MPRKGYRSLTLPEDLYRKLLELAERYGTNVQGIIKIAVSDEKFLQRRPPKSMVEGSNPSGPAITFLTEASKSLTKNYDFSHKGEIGTVLVEPKSTVQLGEFVQFLTVDLRLSRSTARNYKMHVSKALAFCGPDPTVQQIRSYLSTIKNPNTLNNCVKALRRYFRDFLDKADLVRTFKICKVDTPPPRLFTKEELRTFYEALDTEKERAIFLMFATSGRRRSEVLNLTLDQVDVEARVIMPSKSSATKRTWYSFFNEEAQEALREYLKNRTKRSQKLFPISWSDYGTLFRIAHHKTGLHITPQTLRFWFANEMARLGVPDRFIDAFQGRIPRSVLARHYTDYSLENLKAIYDRAGLKVLG